MTVARRDLAPEPPDWMDALVALGGRYDASPRFPKESLDRLRAAGLMTRFAPERSGGDAFDTPQAQALAMMDALREVGRADLSVGRIFEGHLNALALFDWYGTPAQLEWLAQALTRGSVLGVWATEPPPGVRLNDAGRLEGRKIFATGAGSLDYALITAAPERGERRLCLVAADDPSRTDLGAWRVRGMKATVSGSYDLSGMVVEPRALLGEPGDYDREPRFTAGAWRFTAVQLGGVEALVLALRDGLSDAAREDPLQRMKFIEAATASRTAYLWVREAAQRFAEGAPGAEDVARVTRGVVERAALDVMEKAARAIGTRSAFDGERIDKISRDLSLYLRQAQPDQVRDQAARAWLKSDIWGDGDALW